MMRILNGIRVKYMVKTICIILCLMVFCSCSAKPDESSTSVTDSSMTPDISSYTAGSSTSNNIITVSGRNEECWSKCLEDISKAYGSNENNERIAAIEDSYVLKKDLLVYRATEDYMLNSNLAMMRSESERQDFKDQYQRTDRELLDSLIRREIAYKEAFKQGYKEDEKEVIEYTEYRLNSLEESYEPLKAAYGMNDKEFLQDQVSKDKKNIAYSYLRRIYGEKNSISSSDELDEAYNKYLNGLFDEYDVKIYL